MASKYKNLVSITPLSLEGMAMQSLGEGKVMISTSATMVLGKQEGNLLTVKRVDIPLPSFGRLIGAVAKVMNGTRSNALSGLIHGHSSIFFIVLQKKASKMAKTKFPLSFPRRDFRIFGKM